MAKSQKLKIARAEDKILMNIVSNNQPKIRYILGDMIPPIQGSSLFQNSSLNRKLGEICYRLVYRGPNGIPKAVIEREQTVLSLFQILDLEYEIVRRGSSYNFVVWNSPVTGHLGKS